MLKLLIFIIVLLTQTNVYAQEKALPQKVAVSKNSELITLDLRGIDIVEILRILSLKTGITIVPSKGITGRINVFMNNLTFEDALDIILLSQQLAYEKKGNILYIMTDDEYKTNYGRSYTEKRKFKSFKLNYAKPSNVFGAVSQLKSDIGKIIVDESTGTIFVMDIPERINIIERSIVELDKPIEMQIYDLNYAKSADAKAQLSAVITPGLGQVVIDERSSKAMVSDLPDKMKQISKIVKAIDEESRQVFIEGEIVQVTLSNAFQRGIEWEKLFNKWSVLDGVDFVGKYALSPVLTTYQKITVGTIAENMYSVVVNFLETFGNSKVLSRPRITVLDNKEARLMVGRREAYITETTSQSETTVTAQSVQFVDVGIKLNIVPTINKEGFVTLKIKPEVSSVDGLVTGTTVPIVATSEAETVVKVKDGTMVLIAGLIKEEKTDDILGFPVLSRMPLIGGLFGSRKSLTKKTELVIFLTPHIVSGEHVFGGNEAEKFIPAEIMPEDMQKSIISRKVEEIKSQPPDDLTDIQRKIKGMKEQ